eukprot:852294-Pyramimonas_sp.AAC.1
MQLPALGLCVPNHTCGSCFISACRRASHCILQRRPGDPQAMQKEDKRERERGQKERARERERAGELRT